LTPFLILTEQAEQDLIEAQTWYEARGYGLADGFLRALDACFAVIERHPEAFPFSHGQVRRALLRKYPYAVLLRATGKDILIVGCLHTSRDRSSWWDRS
jgi:plasmid stabilization system protein ParE